MKIKVMGPGCKNCETVFNRVQEVIKEKGVEADVEKVTDMNEITNAGVLMTPGLVINDEVKISGRVPSKEEIGEVIDSA
ncbi:thioredoxin family protein [Natranaerobius thermophilus]|uniref:Redox-active disulfide protein 2 n=1 Tax=Natranaerobius thermophilus (strain ATCC BAA-1301 / DSM 18059 / JW/NM-WN-LF) TaxID=457570 RepID=B2A7P0_NATTJ|nr:thioredoxin family protein [Natranaerobius thermophilus]ACB84342.1 redox-active disulfide protein 2 [Natranaerobius thermophilus JW/NM-WN-LF]